MKTRKVLRRKYVWLMVSVCALLALFSCEQNSFAKFESVPSSTKSLESTGLPVISYTVLCNPEANGVMEVKVGNRLNPESFKAKQLSPAQITALIAILESGTATYNKANNEFSFEKTFP